MLKVGKDVQRCTKVSRIEGHWEVHKQERPQEVMTRSRDVTIEMITRKRQKVHYTKDTHVTHGPHCMAISISATIVFDIFMREIFLQFCNFDAILITCVLVTCVGMQTTSDHLLWSYICNHKPTCKICKKNITRKNKIQGQNQNNCTGIVAVVVCISGILPE